MLISSTTGLQISKVDNRCFLSFSVFDHMIADDFSGCKAIDWCMHSLGPIVFFVNGEESIISFFRSYEQIFRRLNQYALANNVTFDLLFLVASEGAISETDLKATANKSIQTICKVIFTVFLISCFHFVNWTRFCFLLRLSFL